jgi:hypothetical protein
VDPKPSTLALPNGLEVGWSATIPLKAKWFASVNWWSMLMMPWSSTYRAGLETA